MKACILSMQKVQNIGSLLQSYGLKKILESRNIDVEFIDIKKIDGDFDLLKSNQMDFRNESEKKGIIGKLFKIDRYIINRLNQKKVKGNQQMIFDSFRRKELEIDKKSSHYDLCVIGSDEVFNCLNSGYWGFTSQLFGNVPEAEEVITYAASSGATNIEDLPDSVVERITTTFKQVKKFSVRDANTFNFVTALTEKEVNYNLDPVLIYDFDNEISKAKFLMEKNKPYCIVYSYYNRIHSGEEIREIKKFCKKNKLEIISVGAPQYWIKNHIVCDPFECLKLFANSSMVITDTFHGTIFASKYSKKFATLLRDSNRNKLSDLINRLGLQNHLVSSFKELESVYPINVNSIELENILEKEKQNTMDYLFE